MEGEAPLSETRPMAQRTLSAEALALLYLREAHGWTQTELAKAKGHSSHRVISRYENGAKPLSRAELHDMAALMGFSPDAVEALLFIYSLASPPSPPEDGSPVDLTPEEIQRIDHAVLLDGWTRATELRARLIEDKKRKKAEAARRKAEELWARLKPLPSSARRELIGDSPHFWNWAFVERLCLESERAAANDPKEALSLAELALSVANRSETGPKCLRLRLMGFSWVFKANAFRVLSDHIEADKAFARGRDLWNSDADSDSGLLPEWRPLALEASFRRDQRRFTEALVLLDRARRLANDASAMAAILLKKEFVCEQMGDLSAALSALEEATSFVADSGDPYLLFALRFKITNNLCHLERYAEASSLLNLVRELAEELGNDLDLIRVCWLSARVAAGQHQWQEAIAGLEQVRRDFSAREIPFDAALSSLDLSLLYLRVGSTGKVKELTREMAPIFRSLGIPRESLVSLALFLEAAQQETATTEMVRQAMADLEKTRKEAPRH